MRMREDENIAKYVKRIKSSVNAIKDFGEKFEDEILISKDLRTLLPIYAISISTIQERRCEENHNIKLDVIVRRLIAFELDNFDNYVIASKNIESTFEANLSLKKKGKRIKNIQSNSKEESKESFAGDLEVVEALLVKK